MKAKTAKTSKAQLADMSVDDFLDNMDFDADSDDDSDMEPPAKILTNGAGKQTHTNGDSKVAETEKKKPKANGDAAKPATEPTKKPVKEKQKKKKKDKAVVKKEQEPEEPAFDSEDDDDDFEIPADIKAKLDKALAKVEKKANKNEKVEKAPVVKKEKPLKKKLKKNQDSDTEEKEEVAPPPVKTKKEKKKKPKKVEESDADSDGGENHNDALEKLKDTDPEFYKFLETNDRKLLKFSVNEESDSDDESDEENAVKKEKVHKPDEKLEVASDESDFEAGSDASDSEDEEDANKPAGRQLKITLKMLKDWERDLQSDEVTNGTIKAVTLAFRSALQSISTEDVEVKQAVYRVEGAAIFNGIIQLCVLYLQPALVKFLKVKNLKFAKQSKRFKRIIAPMRSYLPDITKLLETVASSSILTVLLKHLHQLAPLMPFIFNLTKPILKRLINLWSTSEDTVRVLAFLCILKITRGQQSKFLKDVLRIMYLNYVKNCKFVSPTTLPGINFMRRSLAEMFALDMNVSYNIMFMFVRQLAIHLRNAYTERNKDNILSVYNWQYVNSMRLWGEVLAITHSKVQLQPLLYPLVTIVMGVIRLIPSAQYYPVRFHCCKILVDLTKRTNMFIPVLPFMLEVLKGSKFTAKHKKVSMKPLKFTCLLRLQQSQIDENAWKDEVIDNVNALTLEYLAHESAALAFPDLAINCVNNLRAYLKECKNSKYQRELKQLVDKTVENIQFIEIKRKTITFTLKDFQQIAAWEANIRNKGTPLDAMFKTWAKKHESKKRREASDSDNLNDYNLPMLPKPRPVAQKRARDSGSDTDENEGPTELFPSSESDSELEVEKPLKKAKKQKQPAKKEKKAEPMETEEITPDDVEHSTVDIVKDLNIADWD